MPEPVSNRNGPLCDYSTALSEGSDCDPSNACCAASGAPNPSSANLVSVPDIHIEGDASQQELIRRHDSGAKTPDCSRERNEAALACLLAGGTALVGAPACATGVGAVGAFVTTAAASGYCGKELREWHDCKLQ